MGGATPASSGAGVGLLALQCNTSIKWCRCGGGLMLALQCNTPASSGAGVGKALRAKALASSGARAGSALCYNFFLPLIITLSVL